MKYVGSKRRFAKEIVSVIMESCKSKNTIYVEPFVGGANLIEHVPLVNRVGLDSHPHLIIMWRQVSAGWKPKQIYSESYYRHLREYKPRIPETAYVGFNLSYGARYFEGWARNSKGRCYSTEAYNAALKQFPKLKGVSFYHNSVFDIGRLDPGCIIYCDPPYKTKKIYYGKRFDYDKFWQWARQKTQEGHRVFISEYAAPPDFTSIWEKETKTSLKINGDAAPVKEKLFIFTG